MRRAILATVTHNVLVKSSDSCQTCCNKIDSHVILHNSVVTALAFPHWRCRGGRRSYQELCMEALLCNYFHSNRCYNEFRCSRQFCIEHMHAHRECAIILTTNSALYYTIAHTRRKTFPPSQLSAFEHNSSWNWICQAQRHPKIPAPSRRRNSLYTCKIMLNFSIINAEKIHQ